MIIANYIPCENCKNLDATYTCHKCGKCGREFENGFLVNGNEFPCKRLDSKEEREKC